MKKRLVALTVAMVMMASTLVACDNGSTATPDATGADQTVTDDGAETDGDAADPVDGGDAEVVEEPVEEPAVVEAATLAAPSTDGWDESKKIYFYSWNDEFGSRMQYVLDAYPEYADYVEYVNLGVSGTDGTYQTAIDTLIENNDAKFPSIIAADNDVAKYYTESDMTLSMASIGITDDMYANAYEFSKQYASYNGELKALTWQACPGCFLYRTDIADEVLGASDPETVQGYVKDWDTFFTTAQTMKDAGYAMVAGPDEIKYACFDQQTSPWITVNADGSESLTLDSSVSDFFELSKKLYDGGFTNNAAMWDAAWNGGYEGNVFGYFGCTWSVYWCMVFDDTLGDASSYGKWNVCAGPVGYHWGGTYCMVMDGCPNTELAAFLVYSLCCDEDIMYTLAVDTKDFVNNKAVIEKEVANGDGADPILGGANPVAVWAESVKNIDLSNASYLDAPLKDIITNASAAYNSGEVASVEDAVQYVKDQVAEKYDYITIE